MTTDILKSKLDVIEDRASCKAAVNTLLVFLPGAYDKPADFIQHGFVSALRARNIAADLTLVDAHVGYYTAEQLVERLHHDIIEPARKKGYRHIWLIGVSLGGYGSLLYATQHASEISGLFLMAPFLGNRSLLAEIERIGLPHWQAQSSMGQDDDQQLWLWLKHYCAQMEGTCLDAPLSPSVPFPLYIAYGIADRFTASNRMLAKNLPEQYVTTINGGHDWQTWQSLWNDFLARELLPRCS